MKGVCLLVSLLFVALHTEAQKWNPYVNQGRITPSPLLPLEFRGSGVFSFNVGNNGSEPIKLVANQEMTLMITLSNGIPGTESPLNSLGGTFSGFFTWRYDSLMNYFSGIQIKDISSNSEGTITVGYRVKKGTPVSSPSNGCNVNLQPPPYSNGDNLTGDDAVNAYTGVQARDFGDAPVSYGCAEHEINVMKDPETNEYRNFIYLGNSVDADSACLFSAGADGDNLNGTDDEDGVTFPTLSRGASDTIRISATVKDHGFGMLNAWFDWNGDGDFADTGEQVNKNPVAVFSGGTYRILVTVPDSAIIARPTFARFRIGSNSGPSGKNGWGEAEDYRVTINENKKQTE